MLLVSGMVTIRVVSQSQNQQGFQGHLLLEFVEFCNEFWGISRPVVVLSFLAPYCVQDYRLGSKP